MLAFSIWTASIFAVILFITIVLCICYKRIDDGRIAISAKLALLLSHVYFVLSIPIISYVATIKYSGIGYWWAALIHAILWLAPWYKWDWPLRLLLRWALESSIEFDEINILGNGIITKYPLAYLGKKQVFWARGRKENKEVLGDVIRQIKRQLREQIKNPFKRWQMLHWRWYSLTGGWIATREIGNVIDDGVHNQYKLPITRMTDGGPLGKVSIVEVNT